MYNFLDETTLASMKPIQLPFYFFFYFPYVNKNWKNKNFNFRVAKLMWNVQNEICWKSAPNNEEILIIICKINKQKGKRKEN